MAGIRLVSNDTVYFLEQWGRWARTDTGIKLGYPSIQPFHRLVKGGGGQSPEINDDQGLIMDHAVGQLTLLDESVGRSVLAYFCGGCNLSKVADELNIHRNKAKNFIDAGSVWIQCTVDIGLLKDVI